MSRKNGDSFADNTINARTAIDSAARALPDEDIEEVRADTAKLHKNRVALIRTRRSSSAIGHIAKAADKLVEVGNRRMTDDEYKGVQERIAHAVRLIEQDKSLRKLERQYRKRAARVEAREVDPYGEASEFSWIADCLATRGDQTMAQRVVPGAEERLARHARIVAAAVDRRTKYGRQIEAMYAAQFRSPNVDENRRTVEKRLKEFRAGLTTGGGATASASGGGVAAFVLPSFLLDQFAVYRSPHRVVADQLNRSVKLPDVGLEVYIPSVTAAASVGTTTEGQATTESSDPATTFLSGAVAEKSGQVTITQAALDRFGPGISADVFLMQALKDNLGAQIDLVAITALLAGANSVTNNGSFALGTASGVGGLLGDLHKAKKATVTTAGTHIRSTALFTNSDLADYVLAWSDTQARPIAPPVYSDEEADNPEGFTGYSLSGLLLYSDDNIPTAGTSQLEQLIVTRPDYTLLLEGTPAFALYPQYQAGTLDPVINVRAYVACVPRYPAAVSVISGGAYAAANFA